MRRALIALSLALACGWPATAQQAPQHVEGRASSGAYWAIDYPATWNGTLMLYAHGYNPSPLATPQTAPRGMKDWLLASGYALAASSFSTPGWALEQAPQDQVDALDVFTARFGKPRRTIAWGDSMGGLTTLAVAERFGDRIEGAISMCGSTGGGLGMLNTALDGAFAFKMLLAPASDIRLVGVDDDRANGARVQTVLTDALTTPQGRARVALAGVLAQVPGWTEAGSPEPGAQDYDKQAEQIGKAFVMGVYLPRVDQETRAGGVFSWNTGVDYRAQLRRSGRSTMVRALYQGAGLDLDADLAALNAAPRVAASPSAVAYMRANYVPTGRINKPVLVMHETGDGMTIPNMVRGYADLVRSAGAGRWLGQAFVSQAGHCRFTVEQRVASIRALEARLETGRWSISPTSLNSIGQALGAETHFVEARPVAVLRACSSRAGSCAGEPRGRDARRRQR